MTTTRLGLVALAALGVWTVVSGTSLLAWSQLQEVTPYVVYGTAQVCIGLFLFAARRRLAVYLFSEEEEDPLDRVDMHDAQVVVLSLLGVWLLVHGAADVASASASSTGESAEQFASGLVELVFGAVLAWKGELVARIWAPSKQLDEGAES